jgi:hypothetical protein
LESSNERHGLWAIGHISLRLWVFWTVTRDTCSNAAECAANGF